MRKLARRIVDLGVTEEMGPEAAKYVRMGNLGPLLIILLNLPYMLLCAKEGWGLVLAELFALDALLLATPAINRLGRYELAAAWYGTLLNVHVIFLTVAFGAESLLPLLMLFTAGGAITLFGRGRGALIAASVAAIAAGYWLALTLARALGPLYALEPRQLEELRRYAIFGVFALIVLNATMWRFGGLWTEDRLRDARRRSEELLAALEDRDRSKTRFFQNLTHEIRTPLTLVIGSIEALLADEGESGGAARREKLELAYRNAGRLLRMSNQLLDLARIEAGGLEPRPVPGDLGAFVAGLVEGFGPVAERRGVALRFRAGDGDLRADFDRDIVEKIASNLISNACKYTPPGGEAVVSVEGVSEEGKILVSVRDTGPGIDAGDLGKVFDRFYRSRRAEECGAEGTGIGLNLARELAVLHGAELEARSEPGRGAEFRLILARRDERARGRGEAAPGPGDAGDGPAIIVADDDADMRGFLREALEGFHRVVEARDGAEALDLARRLSPKLVVSDLMMPAMDGVELCRALRADPALRRTPVILLSARAAPDQVLRALEAGADDYETKPFSPAVLAAKARALLQRAGELEGVAPRDGLTGLLSRGAWEREAGRELDRLARAGGRACVGFVDLDDFKSINDTRGHEAGDRVLLELADSLRKVFRVTDLVGRFGGDEFLLFLPDCAAESAVATVERARCEFRSRLEAAGCPPCGFSAGLAELSGERGAPLAEYLRRADAAMYAAKTGGKGSVELWSPG